MTAIEKFDILIAAVRKMQDEGKPVPLRVLDNLFALLTQIDEKHDVAKRRLERKN